MSACLETFFELEGTLEELHAMAKVIKDHCDYHQQASFDYARISYCNNPDDQGAAVLGSLSDDALLEFLTKCKTKVLVNADGPYGSYGGVSDAGVFEAVARSAPNATFKAGTTGFTTGQKDRFFGELNQGILHMSYSIQTNDYRPEDHDGEDDWYTEVHTYDPIGKKYL